MQCRVYDYDYDIEDIFAYLQILGHLVLKWYFK